VIENICLLGIDSPSLSFFTIGVILYFVYGLGESRHFLINDTNINEVNGASISLAVINTLDVST